MNKQNEMCEKFLKEIEPIEKKRLRKKLLRKDDDYSALFYKKIDINYCPLCGRKLRES